MKTTKQVFKMIIEQVEKRNYFISGICYETKLLYNEDKINHFEMINTIDTLYEQIPTIRMNKKFHCEYSKNLYWWERPAHKVRLSFLYHLLKKRL